MKKRWKETGALLALGLLVLGGCQEAPEEEIIVNKNKGVLEEAIQGEGEASENKEEVPKEVQDEFPVGQNGITVQVDAQVEAVEGKLPIVRVAPREITSEDLKKWGNVLFEGKTLYEPETQKSKAEIEEEILWRRQMLNDREALMEMAGSEEGMETYQAVYEEQIQTLEAEYETAPEVVERKETDWAFHPSLYYNTFPLGSEGEDTQDLNKTMTFKAVANTDQGYEAMISASNRNEQDYSLHNLWFYYTEDLAEKIPYKKIEENEALRMSDVVREELGLTDWKLQEVNKDDTSRGSRFVLRYGRVYEEVPVLLAGEAELKSEDVYASNFLYETLEVYILNGIMESVCLNSPMEVVAVENEDVNVISFDKAYELFKSQMETRFAKVRGMEFLVDDIRQGLFRIKIKDEEGEYYMVPAWMFTIKTSSESEGDGEERILLNAVDGSVIDINKGY